MVSVEFLKDEVASVSFNSGKRSNLLSLDVIRKLTEVANKLAQNKKLMAVILSGGHQNFSFGFDLKDKEFLKLKSLGLKRIETTSNLGRSCVTLGKS